MDRIDFVQFVFLGVGFGTWRFGEHRGLTTERLQAVGGKNWMDTLILWKLEGAISGSFIDVDNFIRSFPNCRKLLNFTLFSGKLLVEG
jgi:hypothetical protein